MITFEGLGKATVQLIWLLIIVYGVLMNIWVAIQVWKWLF
jgi:hypothetical protein